MEGGAIEDAIDEFSEVIKYCPNDAMVSTLIEGLHRCKLAYRKFTMC